MQDLPVNLGQSEHSPPCSVWDALRLCSSKVVILGVWLSPGGSLDPHPQEVNESYHQTDCCLPKGVVREVLFSIMEPEGNAS